MTDDRAHGVDFRNREPFLFVREQSLVEKEQLTMLHKQRPRSPWTDLPHIAPPRTARLLTRLADRLRTSLANPVQSPQRFPFTSTAKPNTAIQRLVLK